MTTCAETAGRQNELDFAKYVLILLMIAFHLVYIGDSYPYAKQVVYTFHMPGFLVISGYLLNVRKSWRQFAMAVLCIFVPYVLMESAYVAGAAVLPIREHIDHLSLNLYIDKVLLHPLGPYWYLHTLLLCSMVLFVVSRAKAVPAIGRFVLVGLVYAALWHGGVVSLACALYFLGGAVLRHYGWRLAEVTPRTMWSGFLAALLAFFPENMDKGSVGGVLTVCLVLGFLFSLYRWLQRRNARILRPLLYVGRNTLPLLLFSPVFTVLAKVYQPVLVGMDRSGMVFMVVSVAMAVAGSLWIGWLLDRLHLSRFLFVKEKIMR
ncbi:MAG TPA: acyltransferase [Prevotella sp.]